MAHTYYGSDGLILTSITKENFDSGLSRVDCIYRCRTPNADALEVTLAQGFRVPDRTSYIIRENAKRKDDTDGFTTFTVSGYFGSLVTTPNATNPIPSVLGANVGSCKLTVEVVSVDGGFIPAVYDLQILGDTLTRKFTMRKTDSVTTLTLPSATLSATILLATASSGRVTVGQRYSMSELEDKFSKAQLDFYVPVIVSTYKRGSLSQGLVGNPEIISVNRSSFGEYDEVTVTWGLKYNDFTLRWYEQEGAGWMNPAGLALGGRFAGF